MAKRKEQPKPLFSVKHDFYASLDELCQQGINLITALSFALDRDQVKPDAAEVLRERLDAFRAALSSDD